MMQHAILHYMSVTVYVVKSCSRFWKDRLKLEETAYDPTLISMYKAQRNIIDPKSCQMTFGPERLSMCHPSHEETQGKSHAMRAKTERTIPKGQYLAL